MGAQLLPSGELLGRCRAAGDHEHQEPGERRARLGVTGQPPHEGLRTKPYQERITANQPYGLAARARTSLRRGLGPRWLAEGLHGNALVTHLEDLQVLRSARRVK